MRLRFLRRDRDVSSRREEELEEDLGRNGFMRPFGADRAQCAVAADEVMASGRVRIFSSIERISVAVCRQEGRCGRSNPRKSRRRQGRTARAHDEDHAAGGMSRTMAHVEPRFAGIAQNRLRQASGRARRRARRAESGSPTPPANRAGTCRRVGLDGQPRISRNSAAPPAWSAWPCVRKIFRPWAGLLDGAADQRHVAAGIDHGRHFRRLTDENGAICWKGVTGTMAT